MYIHSKFGSVIKLIFAKVHPFNILIETMKLIFSSDDILTIKQSTAHSAASTGEWMKHGKAKASTLSDFDDNPFFSSPSLKSRSSSSSSPSLKSRSSSSSTSSSSSCDSSSSSTGKGKYDNASKFGAFAALVDPSYSPPLSVDRHPKKTKTIQSPKSDDHAVDPSYSLALSVSRHPKGTNSKGHHQDFHSSPRKTNSKGFNGAYHFHVQTPRLDEHGKMGETLTLLREYLMKNYSADPDAYGKAAERISSLMEHSEKTKKETRGVKGKHSPQTGVRKTSRPHSSHDLRALRTCSSSERGGRMKHQVPHASVPLPDWDWKKGGRVSSMVSTKEVGGNHKDNRVRNYKNSEPRHGRTMRRKSLCYSELTLESGTHQKSSTEQERRRSMCNSELEKSAADGSAISTPKRLGLGISIDRLDGLERDEPKGHSKGAADEITHTLTRRRCVRSTGRLEGPAFEPRKKGPLSRHKKESQRG